MWLTTTFKKERLTNTLVLLLLDSECVGDLQPPKDSPYPTMRNVTYYHINGGDLLPPPMPFIYSKLRKKCCLLNLSSWLNLTMRNSIWKNRRKKEIGYGCIVDCDYLNLMGTCLWERLKYQPNPFQCVISGKMARTAHSLAADSQWEEPKICGPIRSQDWSAGFPIAVTKTISNFAHHFFPCFMWITCACYCGWHCGFRFRQYKFIWQNFDLCQWANVQSLESWHL